MLCSNCSEVVRPIVACDIDGTLGDYHRHFFRFATEYLGKDGHGWYDGNPVGGPNIRNMPGLSRFPLTYDGSVRFSEWVCWAARIDLHTYREMKLAYRQGGQKRSMPLLPDAQEFVRMVRALGADLWLTTTRPYQRLDGIDPDTREWARRHQIRYEGLLYDREKYRRLRERVDPERVVAVIDDLPYLWDQAAESFGPDVPILVRSTYNRAVERPTQANGLAMVFGQVEHRVLRWKEQHG